MDRQLDSIQEEGCTPDRGHHCWIITADRKRVAEHTNGGCSSRIYAELIDSEFAINEGGGGEDPKGKKISNDLQTCENTVVISPSRCATKAATSRLPVAGGVKRHLSPGRLVAGGFPIRISSEELNEKRE